MALESGVMCWPTEAGARLHHSAGMQVSCRGAVEARLGAARRLGGGADSPVPGSGEVFSYLSAPGRPQHVSGTGPPRQHVVGADATGACPPTQRETYTGRPGRPPAEVPAPTTASRHRAGAAGVGGGAAGAGLWG